MMRRKIISSVWPKRIAFGYIGIVLLLILGDFADIYPSAQGTIADQYFSQLFWVSGPIVFLFAEFMAYSFRWLIYNLFDYTFTSSRMIIVIIPGMFHLILGSIQWYFFTKIGIVVWKFLQKIDREEKERENDV